jgi:cell division protein ZapA
MSIETVSINLLDRDFKLKCPVEEIKKLEAAGAYLNTKMQDINKGATTPGFERVVVMAAINVAYELLNLRQEKEGQSESVDARIKALHDKIDEALAASHLELPKPLLGEQQALDI